jgi:RNA polymerase sigma factor (TIGR02999 family)
MSEITQILSQINSGDPAAAEQLLPLVYEELRKLAAAKLAHERPDQTLQATALVHEAYLRLATPNHQQRWDGRAHFFAAAAQAMRRILVDNARRKNRQKHGGDRNRVALQDLAIEPEEHQDDLLALDRALDRLKQVDKTAAELVQLRYFTGLTVDEAADMLDISTRSAERAWTYARAWLHREITDSKAND